MLRWTIGNKIGFGFLLMGVLLLLCGLAGYGVEIQLSRSLHFITGPVWETADTVTDGIDGVRRQLIAVDLVLRDHPDSSGSLEDAKKATATAYARIRETGLLDSGQLEDLTRDLADFDRARETLLASHAAYSRAELELDQNLARFQDFLIEVEKAASQRILEIQMKETDSGGDEDEETASRDSINAATELRLALLVRQYQFRRFLDAPDDADVRQRMDLALEDARYAAETIGQAPVFGRDLERGVFAGSTYRQVLADLLQKNAGFMTRAMKLHRESLSAWGAYRDAAGRLEKLGAAIDASSRKRMAEESATARDSARTGTLTILASVSIGLLVAVGVTLVALRTIARPVRRVLLQMQDVAEGEGDLTAQLAVSGRDEVAELARTFNAFVANMRAMMTRLQAAIHRLGSATAHISDVAGRTGNEVQRQQQDISGIASAVNQLSTNVQAVANDTSQAAEQARAASQAAREGQGIVDESRRLTEQLSGEVEGATDVIHRLGQEGQRIGGVLDVIRDISEQTNLLALNAAIEAARAGEHGRGFAVVADEVRNLAARTHDSTNEIRDMIDRLQQGTREAVAVMDGSRSASQTNVEHAGRTGDSLTAIREAVSAIDALNSHIAEVSELQSRSASEVDGSLSSISEVAAATVGDAQALLGSTGELKQLAAELEELAGRFKV